MITACTAAHRLHSHKRYYNTLTARYEASGASPAAAAVAKAISCSGLSRVFSCVCRPQSPARLCSACTVVFQNNPHFPSLQAPRDAAPACFLCCTYRHVIRQIGYVLQPSAPSLHVDISAGCAVRTVILGDATTASVEQLHDVARREPVLYNPRGIVLSAIQQIVLTNVELVYLTVPRCRALAGTVRTGRLGGVSCGLTRSCCPSVTHVQRPCLRLVR